jgi:hypothetical protein
MERLPRRMVQVGTSTAYNRPAQPVVARPVQQPQQPQQPQQVKK